MRGTSTRSDGARLSLASFASSTPFGNAIEVIRISCASENGTRLTTNCSLARMLARVSLGSRGALLMLNRYYWAINAPNGLFLKHHWFAIMDRLTSMSVFVKVAD